ncbi:hypothetical protein TNCV_3252401 [Trichonephila clavipes]|nr:hypothetical protein TNCV_3252401 [Trichonephila clavipes]
MRNASDQSALSHCLKTGLEFVKPNQHIDFDSICYIRNFEGAEGRKSIRARSFLVGMVSEVSTRVSTSSPDHRFRVASKGDFINKRAKCYFCLYSPEDSEFWTICQLATRHDRRPRTGLGLPSLLFSQKAAVGLCFVGGCGSGVAGVFELQVSNLVPLKIHRVHVQSVVDPCISDVDWGADSGVVLAT